MCLSRLVPRGLSLALIGPFRRRRDRRTPQVRGAVVVVSDGLGALGQGRTVLGWLAEGEEKGMRHQNTFITRKTSHSGGFEGFPIAHFLLVSGLVQGKTDEVGGGVMARLPGDCMKLLPRIVYSLFACLPPCLVSMLHSAESITMGVFVLVFIFVSVFVFCFGYRKGIGTNWLIFQHEAFLYCL